jgi:hypothetical protein
VINKLLFFQFIYLYLKLTKLRTCFECLFTTILLLSFQKSVTTSRRYPLLVSHKNIKYLVYSEETRNSHEYTNVEMYLTICVFMSVFHLVYNILWFILER